MSRLARVSSGRLIVEVDGLRFFAILAVVVFHISETFKNKHHPAIQFEGNWLSTMLRNGHLGVPLFFAISGFILARPYAEGTLFGRSMPSYASYIKRRLLRLEPPYIIALTLKLVLLAFSAWKPGLLLNYVVSAFYLNSILYGKPSEILVAAWSLEIEFQFYLVAPFAAKAYFSLPSAVRRACAGLAICAG